MLAVAVSNHDAIYSHSRRAGIMSSLVVSIECCWPYVSGES